MHASQKNFIFEFGNEIFENFKKIGKAQWYHHFPCDDAPLCQIWVHLKIHRCEFGEEEAKKGRRA